MNRLPPLLLLALIALPCASEAREVYRCRTPDGALRFGDTPCDPSTAEHAAVVLRDPTAAERRRDAAAADARARAYAEVEARRIAQLDAESTSRLPPSLGGASRAAARGSAVSAGGSDRKPSACAAATARREQAYRDRGNSMGFDERRRLQDEKSAACGS